MDKYEQILAIEKIIKENKPAQAFKKMSNDIEHGMRFVLAYLVDSKQEIYASTLSEVMHISRARVGILLKKMENKGYITKNISSKDARIEVIKITELGIKKCYQVRSEINQYISIIIDKIGYAEFCNFLGVASQIKKILEENQNV